MIRIQIICEGAEEWHYIKRILSFNRYNKSHYCFLEPINAKSNSQLVNRYQNEFSKTKSDLILIYCDVDKDIDSFNEMVNKLATNLSIDFDVAKRLFIFSNPVTLQIVLSHFGKVEIKEKGKAENAPEVKRLTGIDNYKAREDQLIEISSKIKYSSCDTLIENLKDVSTNINDVPSTNFLEFITNIEGEDDLWAKELIKAINDIE